MNVVLLALVLGVVAGARIPFQTAINSRLAGRLGAIPPASPVSFAVGTAGLGALLLVTGTGMPLAGTATSHTARRLVVGATLVLVGVVLVRFATRPADAPSSLPSPQRHKL